jgi:integrase
MRGDGRVYQRDNRFWVEYWHRGKQHRESGGKTKEAARKYLRKRLKEIAGDKFIGPREERVTVPELLDDLELHLRTKGAKAMASFKSHVKPIREYFSRTRAVEVTTGMVEKFIESRLTEGKAHATVNRETGALKQAFNLAARVKPPKLTRVPFVPMLNEDNAREGFVEPAAFAGLVEKLPEVVADIARFAFLTGWRRGEILPLRWEAVDRQAREVRLRTSKNRRPRTLPLTGELWDVIEPRWRARDFDDSDGARWPRLSDYVFHGIDGGPIVDFRRSWATTCGKVGLSGLLFHDLRRSAIRNMVRAGVPQSVAMRVTGHKTTAVFIRYDITSETDKREALLKTQAHVAAQTNAKAGGNDLVQARALESAAQVASQLEGPPS